jgi:hypothetical protein
MNEGIDGFDADLGLGGILIFAAGNKEKSKKEDQGCRYPKRSTVHDADLIDTNLVNFGRKD